MAIHKIKTDSHEEWLAERKKSIGGSDAGTICGYNKYSTPFALWAEKTGAIEPEDLSEKEAVRLGHDLEDYVAARFTEATGKKVRRCNYTFRNDKYPFAHANIDREVIGEKAGLECKTTSNFEYIELCEKGEYPAVWYCQMLHYMMVTGFKKWYLAVCCFGRGFYTFEIERTPEIEKEIKALAGIEEGFWKQVEENVAPDVDGFSATSEAVSTIFDHSSEGSSVDLGAVEIHLRQYEAIEKQMAQLQKLLDEEKNHIKLFMKDSEKGVCGAYSVSWKEQERKTFDRKYFEEHYGRIPEDCFKTSGSRPFKFTVKEI